MKEYKLNVDSRILELLGPNLYTNEPLAKHQSHAVFFAARGEIGKCRPPFLA